MNEKDISQIEFNLLLEGDLETWTIFFLCFDPFIKSRIYKNKYNNNFTPEDRDDILSTVQVALLDNIKTWPHHNTPLRFIYRVCNNKCYEYYKKEIKIKRFKHIPYFSYEQSDEEDNNGSESNSNILNYVIEEKFIRKTQLIKPDDIAANRDQIEHLKLLLLEMYKTNNSKCYEIVRMKYFLELSHKQIAKKLGIALQTSTARLSKCLEKLRNMKNNEKFRSISPN